MSALYDTLRQMIRRELASHRFAEIGTVQAVYPSDPGPYSADVVLRGTELVLRHVPVATPRKGFASLPEVGGDLASYFDPFSTEDIAEKMLQLEASGHAEHAAGNHLEKLFDWDENVARLKQALAHPPQRQ